MNTPTQAHKIMWTFPDKLVQVSDNDIDDDTLNKNAREHCVKGDKLIVQHCAELKKFNDAFGKVLAVLGEEQVDEDVGLGFKGGEDSMSVKETTQDTIIIKVDCKAQSALHLLSP
jgi:hypothetical protein